MDIPTEPEIRAFVRANNALLGTASSVSDDQLQQQTVAISDILQVLARQKTTTNSLLHVRVCHRDVFVGQFAHNGEYRTTDQVAVEEWPNGVEEISLVSYLQLPRLMSEYAQQIMVELPRVRSGDSDEAPELFCRRMHWRGISIHPFVAGNGRVFRLYENLLRLHCKLPWLIPETTMTARQQYYRDFSLYHRSFQSEQALYFAA